MWLTFLKNEGFKISEAEQKQNAQDEAGMETTLINKNKDSLYILTPETTVDSSLSS